MLSDLDIKFKYDSDKDNLVEEFYIPVLSNSVEYLRMSGFFSSSSLAISARGISKLIENDGKMKLLCSAKLSEEDLDALERSNENPEKYIEESFINELYSLEEGFVKDHVEALGWMLANDSLEIKIAIPENGRGMFHSKVGILKDNYGNKVSFSGSDNETAQGWLFNIEEFKVFRSWDDSEEKFVNQDLEDFEDYWNHNTFKTKIIDLPIAIKNELIALAPSSKLDLNLLDDGKRIKLRDYQVQAMDAWFDNGCKGLFEMATGTGKTFTALSSFKKLSDSKDRLLTVIACPQSHLIDQWIKDVEKFHEGPIITASSKNSKWKEDLQDLRKDFYFELVDKAVVMTTHKSLASDFFMEHISNFKVEKMLIVDEVHGVGSTQQHIGLLEDYDYRLGLSATPNRWMDPKGTQIVFNYFKGVVFEFDIERALMDINPDTGETYLAPYEYRPIIVDLNREEYREFDYYTSKIDEILDEQSKGGATNENRLKKLLNSRKDIVDNAYAKYGAFIDILKENPDIDKLIVYCSYLQIDDVQKILNNQRIIPQHRFTSSESARKTIKNPVSERELLLKGFAEGSYKALVAIKCLDEGVDVPAAENAIIMSSTSNPREHVQRRGRILRRYPGKEKAIIYDILVFPRTHSVYAAELIKKDVKRYYEFAKNAENSWECLQLLKKIYANRLL